ncbi:hypothetical protein R84981_002180 [Carnimonas sp. R-84981]|uniref:hypothetical protein n=1 Tax=Carnimonas bestiolae TaxID=3402172 RepID=UPI003EDBD4C2
MISIKKTAALAAVIGCFATSMAAGQTQKVHSVPDKSTQHTKVDGRQQPPITYANIWADENGVSHVRHCRIEGLDFKSYAPPAAPQWIGASPDQIDSIDYAVLPPGYVGEWHHAPGPQWVVTLSGKWEVETADGSKVTQGPGEMQFNADSSAHATKNSPHVGHVSRTVGDQPNVQLIIKLKPNVNSHAHAECAY